METKICLLSGDKVSLDEEKLFDLQLMKPLETKQLIYLAKMVLE